MRLEVVVTIKAFRRRQAAAGRSVYWLNAPSVAFRMKVKGAVSLNSARESSSSSKADAGHGKSRGAPAGAPISWLARPG